MMRLPVEWSLSCSPRRRIPGDRTAHEWNAAVGVENKLPCRVTAKGGEKSPMAYSSDRLMKRHDEDDREDEGEEEEEEEIKKAEQTSKGGASRLTLIINPGNGMKDDEFGWRRSE